MTKRRRSGSISSMSLMNEDKSAPSSFSVSQSTSVTASSSSSTSRSWIDPIQIGSPMRLDDCMNFVAKVIGIQIPMDGHMSRTFRYISTNMTAELLAMMLNDYVDLLKLNLNIIPFDENMLIDHQRRSVFIGTSHRVDGQSMHQRWVFLLYDCRPQMFVPIYVLHVDNSKKVSFDETEYKIICEDICGFIDQYNRPKMQHSTSIVNIITGDNNGSNSGHTYDGIAQYCSTSTVDKDVFMPASKVIKNQLQVVSQMVAQIASQIDHIQLKQKSKHALLSDFDRFSDKKKNGMVHDEILSIGENFRTVSAPDHEEEVEDFSSMKIEDERCFTVLGDMESNLNTSLVPVKQKTSDGFTSSSIAAHSIATASCQLPNIVARDQTALKVTREPRGHQHVRMFGELASGICPLIQANGKDTSQQTYMEIELSETHGTELYVGARAVTVAKDKHPYKSVVPQNPLIDMSLVDLHGERSCLKCDKNDFDPELGYTYSLINPDERTRGRKEILAHLINWSRQGIGHKARVISENLHLCKIEFLLCVRNDLGGYAFVSPTFYSSIIEEGDGPVNIIRDPDQKKDLCERGGQKMIFPLTVKCPKRGFHIRFNGEELDNKNFKIHQKQLLILSPAKMANNAKLHLEILRDEYNDETGANDPRTLYNPTFDYISHDDQATHVCCAQNFV